MKNIQKIKKEHYINNGGINGSPIFFQPWWLDIVCSKGEWDVCLHLNKEGKILGVLPYFFTSFLGVKTIRTPPFTPYLGVWLDYSACSGKLAKRYGFENEVIGHLIEQLPKVASYHQVHPIQFQNWMPFFWVGFRQTTRYIYVIEKHKLNNIKEIIGKNQRKHLKIAFNNLIVSYEFNTDLFLELLNKSYNWQKFNQKINKNMFEEILIEGIKRNQAQAIFAVDKTTKLGLAAQLFVWDSHSVYLLLHGLDRNSGRCDGASALLIWHVIEFAKRKNLNVNFCGSMLQGVANFNASFGAEQRPVFQLRKFGNRFLEAAWVLLKG